MSADHQAENQWAEIGDEAPQDHHQAPQPHQAAQANQWQELDDEEPRQVEAAETNPQEEYPEEVASHHHDREVPAEENHHQHPVSEHQQLRAHHEEEPTQPAQQWEELGDQPQEEHTEHHHPHEVEGHQPHQQLRSYHEEAAEERDAPAEQWTEQEDDAPALRAHDEENAVESAPHHDEHHHHPEDAYPTEEPAESQPQAYPEEDTRDAQDQAESEQPAQQWEELGDQPQEEHTEHHHPHEVESHQPHQQLRSYHEEAAEERDAPAEQWTEQEDDTPALRAHDEENAVESAPHHDEHHHHPEDAYPTEEPAESQPQAYPEEDTRDAQDQAESEQPAQQWEELGDQPQEHHPEHHHQHHGEHAHQPIRAYDEEAAAQSAPHGDQWAELDDQPQEQHHHHHDENAQSPVETAYETEKPEHQARSMPPPQHARALPGAIVKPRTRNVKGVARWEPVEHQPRDESDDEFEMSTCMAPVYEGEGEAGNEDASVFKNGEPDCQGEIMSCFDEPNLLYRIIDPKEKTWAFYNDSLNYEMHVQFTFGKHSKLQPLEDTVMKQNDEGQFVTEVVVYPTETEMFVQGSVNGFTSKLRAVPLSDEYHNARRGITEEQVTSETAAIQQLTDSDNAEDVLQACIENGIAFVDPEFPPCQASLETGATKPFKPLAWARPQACVPEEMAAQVRLFRSAVQPGCVDAGDLGDSWVMCSVAAVSEDPARLMGMFRHPEGKAAAQREHAVGAYRVTFNKNGWWRSVLVDSYLPVSAGKLKYAKSAVDPAEIWPAILEKAYAKLHGSYAKICSGDPLHALQDMTGFSTMRFDESLGSEKDSIQLFDDLVRGIAAGYTVICSTPGRGPNDKDQELSEGYAKVGLVTGHAYTILDAKFVADLNVRIVKVRNAWGRGLEWNGDWSDNDSKWEEYPEVADVCEFQKAADGTFWMPWEAAQKYFNGGGVCFSHQPAYDYRMNSVFTNGVPSAVLEIEVSSPTWFTFVISQDDKRCQENVTEYQPVMISVAEPVDGDMYKVVLNSSADGVHPTPDKWTFLQARDISLIHKLDAGKYIIIPRNMPSDAEPVPYVLGMISNKEIGGGDVTVKFKRLDASNRVFENFPKFEPELKEVEQPVQFQKRAPGEGFPLTQMGEELA